MTTEKERLIDLVERAGHTDLSASMERLYDRLEHAYPDEDAIDRSLEETTLPIYEDDRQDAFAFGMMFGTLIEEEFSFGDEDE